MVMSAASNPNTRADKIPGVNHTAKGTDHVIFPTAH
jgi:hypothetical protein